MPQPSTMNDLLKSNSELTKKPESTSYNWKALTKAGLVFVATTGVFLTLKATKSFSLISSWLKGKETGFNEQETTELAVHEETEELKAYFKYQSGLGLNSMGMPEKIGPEFQVNTFTVDNQMYPSVARFENSKFVVIWQSEGFYATDRGIKGQIYNADGSRYASEFQVSSCKKDFKYSSLSGLSDDKFVVTWYGGNDGSFDGIYGQMYNADGSKYASEFQVNTYTNLDQMYPSVAGLSDGKFVVTWQSWQDGDYFGIYGQMYNADGSKYASEFQVNTYTTSSQIHPSAAGLGSGKFVVTWSSLDQDGSGYDVFGQMYNANGSKYASEFQVNTYTEYDQWFSSVVGLNNGKFVVAWWGSQNGIDYDVYGQMYNADSSKYASEFRVNTYKTDHQTYPSVAKLSDSRFVVTWTSDGQDGSDHGVYGQMYNMNGSRYFSEFQVNTYTVNYQGYPSIVGLSDGRFVVTWMSNGQDGDGYGIYGQMFKGCNSSSSSYFSSSQYISESSNTVSSNPTASSLGTSSSSITSGTGVSSDSSEQISSVMRNSSPISSVVYSSLSMLSSFFSSSIRTSSSYSSISSMLETSSSVKRVSSAESPSYSSKTSSLSDEPTDSSSTKLISSVKSTLSLSDETIYSDSKYNGGLSSTEITAIVLSAIAAVGFCIVGGFFAAKRVCKPSQKQLSEDKMLSLDTPLMAEP